VKIEDIERKELTDFLDWVISDSRAARGDGNGLEHYVQGIEKLVGRRLGNDSPNVKGLGLTLYSVAMKRRSLSWYFVSLHCILTYLVEGINSNRKILITIVNTITHIRMLWSGFDSHCTRATCIDVFPPRLAVLITSPKQSPPKQLSYWLRPHTSKTRLLVLFIHGIGVGLISNINLLADLDLALPSL
jgi:hypothetical protein